SLRCTRAGVPRGRSQLSGGGRGVAGYLCRARRDRSVRYPTCRQCADAGQLGARRAVTGFCRDCLGDVPDGTARCPVCRSPRLVPHRELHALWIAHVDCDAFYATIEKRDNPALADQPVLVGGGKRGVVAAACYVARTYGIRSAMPMFDALQRCPRAVVVRPDMAKYAAVGREVRQAMLALTPLVEPLSIDEAFMDLAGTERLHGMSPAKSLARFA